MPPTRIVESFFLLIVVFLTPMKAFRTVYEEADESSESIKSSILNALRQLQLNIANVTAFGADNASVNYGKHCSVYQKLTELKPKSKRTVTATYYIMQPNILSDY